MFCFVYKNDRFSWTLIVRFVMYKLDLFETEKPVYRFFRC